MGGSSSRERAWAPDYGGEVSSLRKYVHSVDKEVLSLRDYVHDVIAQGHRVVTLDVDLVKARVGKLESTIKTIEAWQKVADRKLVRVEKSCKHMVLIMGGVALVVVIAITVHTAYVVAKVNKQEEM